MVLTNHAYILLKDNSVWAMGSNLEGQLGLNDRGVSESLKPRKILDDILDISAGEDYGIFIDWRGRLIGCGKNNMFQLGMGGDTKVFSTTVLDIRDPDTAAPISFIAVSCGGSHSCAIDTNKELWVTGNNKYGQCSAFQAKGAYASWTRIKLYDPDTGVPLKFDEVHCGIDHTVLLTEDRMSIYTMGGNYRAELGIGSLYKFGGPFHTLKANEDIEIKKLIALKAIGKLGDADAIPPIYDGDISLDTGADIISTSREPESARIWKDTVNGNSYFEFREYVYTITAGDIVENLDVLGSGFVRGRIDDESGEVINIDNNDVETINSTILNEKTTTFLYFFVDTDGNTYTQYNGKVYKLFEGTVDNLGTGLIQNGTLPESEAPSDRLEPNHFLKIIVIGQTNFALENDGTLWAWGTWVDGKNLPMPQKTLEEVIDIKITGSRVYAQMYTDNITDNAYDMEIPMPDNRYHDDLFQTRKLTFWENPFNRVKRTTGSLFLEVKLDESDWRRVY